MTDNDFEKHHIFLSSTLLDLIEERKNIVNLLYELDYIPEFIDSILPLKDSWKYTKEAIEKCDYYFLILRENCGIYNKTTEKLYSEMEFDYASKLEKPIFVYINENFNPFVLRSEEKINKEIEANLDFHVKIERNNPAKQWKITSDLISKISNDLSKYDRKIDQPIKCDFSTRKIERIFNEPIILLSHSSENKEYGDVFEKFIVGLGIRNDQLIYTSHENHLIPLNENIYKYLEKNIHKNTYALILWSNSYLKSIPCICELGAIWIVKSQYTNIFTPKFNRRNPKFVDSPVDIQSIGILLRGNLLKMRMTELKDRLIKIFNLEIGEKEIQKLIDEFIKDIEKIENK